VLRNDAACQAVRFDDGTLIAAFHAPAEIRENDSIILSTGQICILILNTGTVHLADPLRTGGHA
jgi:chondroitin AC lyase